MRQGLLASAGAFAILLASSAHAGGNSGGGPVGDPGDPPACDADSGEICDGGDGGDAGGGGTGGGGTGGTGTGGGTNTPIPYTYGSGTTLFTLNSLPTGPSGTQAFYQPNQLNGALGLPDLPSSQGGLFETVGGTTVSLHTADWVAGGSAPQTRIRVENDTANFNYLGVPTGVDVGIEATTFSADAPGAIYANFSDGLSYFSINLYRLSGAFDVNSTIYAYSGLNGTGTLLGTASGVINGGNNFAFTTIELGNLAGARSFAIQGGSALANYDDITATLAPPAAVPEPATWMLSIAGFGLIGASLRRRRTSIRFA